MKITQRKKHWENIFATKDTSKVSWHQQVPETSLLLIEKVQFKKNAKIIEVGCGDSYLPDELIKLGYTDITLVDISLTALEKIRTRLGEKSTNITFIEADVANFHPPQKYHLWHDRAVFHFLTEKKEIENYIQTISNYIMEDGCLILGTFSDNGPGQCSGLNIKQYSEKEMIDMLKTYFRKIECFTENHKTPSGGSQNFLFCTFRKM